MARDTLRFATSLAALAALICATPAPAAGQATSGTGTSDTVRIGLDEAIARALRDNPGLGAAAQQARAADRAAAASFRQHFGDLEAVAWTSHYDEAQLLRPISQELLAGGLASLPFAQNQLHYGLTFELPLFLGGKLLGASHVARLKADEAGALLEGTRWQVRANVITTYAATQALTAATHAYRDEVSALEETYARVELMVREGKRPEVDLLEVTDALEEARAQLADAVAQRTRVHAFLLALLDWPADQTLALDSLPSRSPALPPDSVDWDALVQRSSPVVTAQLRLRQATGGKHVALGDFLPKLSLTGNVLENAGSGVAGPQQTWELTLQASVPVFTGGRHVAAYQSAVATERAAELALRQTLLQQQAEVRGALARLRAAQDALDAAGKRVAAAEEAARIQGLRYENGAGTIEDLLRAHTRASAAVAFLAESQGNVLGAAAQLNALVEQEIVQ
jgi:outer membrane protein